MSDPVTAGGEPALPFGSHQAKSCPKKWCWGVGNVEQVGTVSDIVCMDHLGSFVT